MRNGFGVFLVVAVILAGTSSVMAGRPFGELFYDGEAVRTIVPPAAMSKTGRDNLYVVLGAGAEGQLGIAAVAPGDREYHGGKWAFWAVTWEVVPYLLTSEAEVLAAEAAGDVTINRIPVMDFKCPIQP
jgi:hypothetical protein